MACLRALSQSSVTVDGSDYFHFRDEETNLEKVCNLSDFTE